LASHRVQIDRASGWQERESTLDLMEELLPRPADQSPEAPIEPELTPVVRHEVEHRADGLPLGASESTTELLKKQGRALRGAEQQKSVHVRHVDAFVEQVHGEDHPRLTGPQGGQRPAAVRLAAFAPNGHSRNPRTHEDLCHETGVIHADAEAKCPHAVRVQRVSTHLFHDQPRRPLVPYQDTTERGDVVAPSAPPRDVTQIVGVCDPEVQERHQVLAVDRIPESQLCCDPTAEPVEDRE
jgi:hypothetical protein